MKKIIIFILLATMTVAVNAQRFEKIEKTYIKNVPVSISIIKVDNIEYISCLKVGKYIDGIIIKLNNNPNATKDNKIKFKDKTKISSLTEFVGSFIIVEVNGSEYICCISTGSIIFHRYINGEKMMDQKMDEQIDGTIHEQNEL